MRDLHLHFGAARLLDAQPSRQSPPDTLALVTPSYPATSLLQKHIRTVFYQYLTWSSLSSELVLNDGTVFAAFLAHPLRLWLSRLHLCPLVPPLPTPYHLLPSASPLVVVQDWPPSFALAYPVSAHHPYAVRGVVRARRGRSHCSDDCGRLRRLARRRRACRRRTRMGRGEDRRLQEGARRREGVVRVLRPANKGPWHPASPSRQPDYKLTQLPCSRPRLVIH